MQPAQTSDPFAVAADILDPPVSPEADKLEQAWLKAARDKQIEPADNWFIWLLLAGRGFGKTRVGAEWVRKKALAQANQRIAVVAATYPDGRDTCVEGESGLLAVIPDRLIVNWNRSMGELDLTNGTHIKLFTAEKPERLRGPQHHWAWCDELAAWQYPETWDQLMFGLRLGVAPKVVVTTTPKPTDLIRELVERRDVHLTTGSMRENIENLAATVVAELEAKYGGTRLGRQELDAEILEDIEGALWSRDMIENLRLSDAPAGFKRVVVGVDPSGGGQSEVGIVAAGIDAQGHAYVLEDGSGHLSPNAWAAKATGIYTERRADRIVGESNYGGDMVENVIRQADPTVAYKAVTATRGKLLRAEPIAALYEQGKVHHVGVFPELEDQMCTFIPGESKSPDRLDALVWALTELMLGRVKPDVAPIGVTGQSSWRG